MVKRAVIFCFILFFTFLSVSPLSAQTRESWQKLERNGQGYGYDHIIAEDLANGNIKYMIYQTIKTDIAGYNPQDITQKGFYIVDEDMNPVAFDIHIKFKTTQTHTTGKIRDKTLFLTRQVNKEEIQNQEIPFMDVYFEVIMGSVISQKKDLGNFSLKVFNPVEGKVNEYDVEVIPDDKGSIIAKVKERINMIFHIDKKGRVKQIKFVELNSRSYVTTARNAKRINYLNTADGLTLTVPCKPQFPNVWDINKAQISIKWKKIPFEQFRFTDNRQKVIDKVQNGDEYEVMLEIYKPLLPSNDAKFLIQDESLAPFLKNSEFIKPDDPAIRKQLLEIKGDKKDALSLVKNILLWVYENIGTEYIAVTLSGPEVLKRKRGKCVEFSTLFASLARAAGILVVNPSHIKFIDSPTVMGTQKIRWKLVDNLGIEILNYQK